MPRFYVKNNKDKWNIYSSIVDDLLFDEFIDFNKLKEYACREAYEIKDKELDTLLTDRPKLNTMQYDECLEKIKFYNRKRYDELKGE